MEKYTLEFLRSTFEEHSEKYMANPTFNSDEFNLPCALKTIVEELIALKLGDKEETEQEK